jgi:hypothetical protein
VNLPAVCRTVRAANFVSYSTSTDPVAQVRAETFPPLAQSQQPPPESQFAPSPEISNDDETQTAAALHAKRSKVDDGAHDVLQPNVKFESLNEQPLFYGDIPDDGPIDYHDVDVGQGSPEELADAIEGLVTSVEQAGMFWMVYRDCNSW